MELGNKSGDDGRWLKKEQNFDVHFDVYFDVWTNRMKSWWLKNYETKVEVDCVNNAKIKEETALELNLAMFSGWMQWAEKKTTCQS